METDPLSKVFGNDAEVLKAARAGCSLKRFARGETLLSQEDEDDEVFLLLEGSVRAIVLSDEGHEIWLEDFGPGEFFGEMAAIGGFERTSNINAITGVTVAIFQANVFLELMKRHGSIGLAVSKILVGRIRSTTRRMFELSVLSAPGRIYAELLRLSKTIEDDGEKRIIKPAPVLSNFARRVNSTRETVSRAINDLEKRGLIIREKDAMIIVAPKKLGGLIT